MEPSQATYVMEEANKILEDFSTHKYILYAAIFTVEIAICFWVALKVL